MTICLLSFVFLLLLYFFWKFLTKTTAVSWRKQTPLDSTFLRPELMKRETQLKKIRTPMTHFLNLCAYVHSWNLRLLTIAKLHSSVDVNLLIKNRQTGYTFLPAEISWRLPVNPYMIIPNSNQNDKM